MKAPAVLLVLATLALAGSPVRAQRDRPAATLPAFRSDGELVGFFLRVADVRERRRLAAEQRDRDLLGCKDVVRVSRGRTAAATGAPQPAVVRGRVTGAAGAPARGASLAIRALGLATATGADGRFLFLLPAARLTPPRRVTLAVQLGGHQPLQRTLDVAPGDSIDVAFPLCAQPAQTGQPVMPMAAQESAAPGAQGGAESVTNVQHAGVDEGGIVKVHGDHLVVLRRGRLFTLSLGAGSLRPVAAVDAFGPGIDPRGAWYDEMLVAGDKVVVIGFSYARGGTELGVFRIDADGGLRHLATYQLRSNDYYSSRNYASRLIGSRLVFYAPLYLPPDLDDPHAALPSMRRWAPAAGGGRFEPIVTPQRVYRPGPDAASADPDNLALHTVTTCDLAAPDLRCEATVVLGPPGRVFYVSPAAVYVWMSGWGRRERAAAATVVRMPLDGGEPSALGVSGSPVDQFSFLEAGDGRLHVLVRSGAGGDAMWDAEDARGAAALLSVPLESFGDGSTAAPPSRYRRLPTPRGGPAFQNRFVGEHLLYGAGNGWGEPVQDSATLYVVPLGGGAIARLRLPHSVDRIEAMGPDAVAVGTSGEDLSFSGIRLDGEPAVAGRYTMAGASQGELRSHGFFYRADGPHAGVLGLPVRGPGRPGYEHLFSASASVLFLRRTATGFAALGTLAAHAEGAGDDGCQASCVDWYGNARPLFLRGRILALLGYELVEGELRPGGMVERRRISFAPGAARD